MLVAPKHLHEQRELMRAELVRPLAGRDRRFIPLAVAGDGVDVERLVAREVLGPLPAFPSVLLVPARHPDRMQLSAGEVVPGSSALVRFRQSQFQM